ncbi:hypothetical protein [Candidatus Synchoanobacter obligatus]|uniref:Uncharacterized protein n=1 Tax=Candidatus Synchoanobacter obligatus TaxID=2919597 RepID=A0ABT1L5I5_9GAMM|nr:hypothetical protein [Candidatus Synchoanobacter obligatus]MCP8352434.1 hypothetical protein [Candidatus Synchoanobacter obligatus]
MSGFLNNYVTENVVIFFLAIVVLVGDVGYLQEVMHTVSNYAFSLLLLLNVSVYLDNNKKALEVFKYNGVSYVLYRLLTEVSHHHVMACYRIVVVTTFLYTATMLGKVFCVIEKMSKSRHQGLRESFYHSGGPAVSEVSIYPSYRSLVGAMTSFQTGHSGKSIICLFGVVVGVGDVYYLQDLMHVLSNMVFFSLILSNIWVYFDGHQPALVVLRDNGTSYVAYQIFTKLSHHHYFMPFYRMMVVMTFLHTATMAGKVYCAMAKMYKNHDGSLEVSFHRIGAGLASVAPIFPSYRLLVSANACYQNAYLYRGPQEHMEEALSHGF